MPLTFKDGDIVEYAGQPGNWEIVEAGFDDSRTLAVTIVDPNYVGDGIPPTALVRDLSQLKLMTF